MTITFYCEACPSEFTVDDKLAGRSGRCKRCGAKFVVPQTAPAPNRMALKFATLDSLAVAPKSANRPLVKTATSGQPRKSTDPVAKQGAVPAREEQPLQLAESTGPRRVSAPQRPVAWLNAVQSQIALKPISLNNLGSLRREEVLKSDSASYDVAANDMRRINKKSKKSRGPGFIKVSYRGVFNRSAKAFRWINETAYGLSILFIFMAIIGYIIQMTSTVAIASEQHGESANHANAESVPEIPQNPPKQNRWFTLGVSGIVILNSVRLAAGLANLIAIAFRKSPMNGVMFLVPPFTFLYLSQNWKTVRKPVGRIIEPAITLAIVVAIYAFVPNLSKVHRGSGDLGSQISGAVKSLEGDVGQGVKDARKDINAIQKTIPSKIDKAYKAAGGLQDEATKAAAGLQNQVQSAVENLNKSGQSESANEQEGDKPSPAAPDQNSKKSPN